MADRFVIGASKRAAADLTEHAASVLHLAFVGKRCTQQDIGELLGITQVAVSKMLNDPSLNDVARVASVLDCRVKLELIPFDPEKVEYDTVVYHAGDKGVQAQK